ncbi:MAG: serine hydrolase domain-containing protein [Bacteroidota bacterium]
MKKVSMRAISAVIILLNFLSGCTPPELFPVRDEAALTDRIQAIYDDTSLPGFTVGIVDEGIPIYQQSFGFQDLEGQVPYTQQTLQPIGSVSKVFIGVATVKAIQLGYFTLETPINDILPTPLVNPKARDGVIRVKHLVNHTSGLTNADATYTQTYYILEGESTATEGARYMLDGGIRQRAPKSLGSFLENYYWAGGEYYTEDNFTKHLPGAKEVYTNTGASLMAWLIELASGVPYQDFLEEHIFMPLGMDRTSFDYALPGEQYATLYLDEHTPLPRYNLESFPDGALKTSNDDLMKFLLHMIAGQRGETTLLFDTRYYQMLFTPTSDDYSIFWGVVGDDLFGHTGGDPGLGTTLSFQGSTAQGVFVLSNYDTSEPTHERYLGRVMGRVDRSIQSYLRNR